MPDLSYTYKRERGRFQPYFVLISTSTAQNTELGELRSPHLSMVGRRGARMVEEA